MLITIYVRTCLGWLGKMQVLSRGFLLYFNVSLNLVTVRSLKFRNTAPLNSVPPKDLCKAPGSSSPLTFRLKPSGLQECPPPSNSGWAPLSSFPSRTCTWHQLTILLPTWRSVQPDYVKCDYVCLNVVSWNQTGIFIQKEAQRCRSKTKYKWTVFSVLNYILQFNNSKSI